ncbi:MAG TPA: hypothetical protein VFJ82_10020, partial [Longimicrobium sp.]|nr:hypothetical protein [Longimicrobium sp.]
VDASPLLRRAPHPPLLRISEDPENLETALIWVRRFTEIEVFTGFLADVHAEVSGNAAAIHAACMDGLQPGERGWAAPGEVCRRVLGRSLSFILLHELFHFYCGHVDELRARSGDPSRAFCLDERHLGMAAAPQGAAEDEAFLTAYYREMEADNSAVQWMMLAAPWQPPAAEAATPRRGPRPRPAPPMLLRGAARILEFRVLLVTLWLMIRLMERKRGPAVRERGAEHPLPAARMLAGVATVHEAFAGIDGWKINAAGEKVRTLETVHVRRMRRFLRHVFKPVLRAFVTGMAPGDDGFQASPVWIALDTGNLLLGNEPVTEPGRQVKRVERLRPRMLARLEPFRYFNADG